MAPLGTTWVVRTDMSPETLRKRIERVRRRMKQSLAKPGTELAAENRRE